MTVQDDVEAELRKYLSDIGIEALRREGLEYACLIAEHTGRQKSGDVFEQSCQDEITFAELGAYQLITSDLTEELDLTLDELKRSKINLPIPKRSKMREEIMRCFGSKHWQDYMPNEDWSKYQREVFNNLRRRCNKAYGWIDRQ